MSWAFGERAGEFEYPKHGRIIIGGVDILGKALEIDLAGGSGANSACVFRLSIRATARSHGVSRDGGFDEQVTLFCLHADQSSSRAFAGFYPRLPTCVRSMHRISRVSANPIPRPLQALREAAGAISDLADDLRLRQIDLLGIHSGARAALDLAAARPALVRRLVLAGVPSRRAYRRSSNRHSSCARSLKPPTISPSSKAALPNGKFVDIDDYANDLFAAAPKTLAKQIATFLSG